MYKTAIIIRFMYFIFLFSVLKITVSPVATSGYSRRSLVSTFKNRRAGDYDLEVTSPTSHGYWLAMRVNTACPVQLLTGTIPVF